MKDLGWLPELLQLTAVPDYHQLVVSETVSQDRVGHVLALDDVQSVSRSDYKQQVSSHMHK